MGEVNNVVCDYLGHPFYYADFWNGTVFRGKRRIKMWQLKRHDREYYKRKNKEGKTGNVRRDVQELQRQIKDIRKKRRGIPEKTDVANEPGEYLYGLKRSDKLLPVCTIGLYCGEGTYSGSSDVLDMLDVDGLEPEYRELLKNYKVKIYNLADLQEERYESSLREIIAIFKRSKDRESMKQYYREHKERFRRLDEISIDTMGVLIGKKTLKLFPQEEGGLDMCKAFEDERAEGKAEGKAEGERIGREKGAFAMLCDLVKDGMVKIEDAAKRMNMTEEVFCSKMNEL